MIFDTLGKDSLLSFMMPLTDCFWLFHIGLKPRSHKACFEDPSCSSVNYQIFGATNAFSRYSECHHGSSRNHDQIVIANIGWLYLIQLLATKCHIEQKAIFLLRSDVLLCKHTIK